MSATPYAVVGNLAFHKDIPQGLCSDFYWPLEIWDIPAGGTIADRTATDLTGSVFTFKIYDPTGATAWITKTNGSGLMVTDNNVVIYFDKAAWTVMDKVFIKGCKYDYTLDWTTAAGFDREYFAGKIIFG